MYVAVFLSSYIRVFPVATEDMESRDCPGKPGPIGDISCTKMTPVPSSGAPCCDPPPRARSDGVVRPSERPESSRGVCS